MHGKMLHTEIVSVTFRWQLMVKQLMFVILIWQAFKIRTGRIWLALVGVY